MIIIINNNDNNNNNNNNNGRFAIKKILKLYLGILLTFLDFIYLTTAC